MVAWNTNKSSMKFGILSAHDLKDVIIVGVFFNHIHHLLFHSQKRMLLHKLYLLMRLMSIPTSYVKKNNKIFST